MGCGCKNKEQEPVSSQELEKKRLESSQAIKESIKKTVEKYYNQSNNG